MYHNVMLFFVRSNVFLALTRAELMFYVLGFGLLSECINIVFIVADVGGGDGSVVGSALR